MRRQDGRERRRASGRLTGARGMPAGQTDLAPTVLALLGIDPAPLPYLGRNLLGVDGDRPVPRPYGDWLDARHLFLAGSRGSSCYDLGRRVVVAPCRVCRGRRTRARARETVAADRDRGSAAAAATRVLTAQSAAVSTMLRVHMRAFVVGVRPPPRADVASGLRTGSAAADSVGRRRSARLDSDDFRRTIRIWPTAAT